MYNPTLRHTGRSSLSTRGRSHAVRGSVGRRPINRAVVEAVERRVLLTVSLQNAIPTAINPATAPQELFAPGANTYTLQSPFNTVVSRFFRFAVNNDAQGQTTVFRTQLNSGNFTGSDAAIALYDASGNRIALADADNFLNGPAAETLTASLDSGATYTIGFFGLQSNQFAFTSTLGLSVDIGDQAYADAIRLDPATGFAALLTASVPNAFTASSNVRYFEIDFVNAAGQASINLSPGGPDSSVRASLFLESASETYLLQSTTALGVGQSGVLTVSPPSGANITDGRYVLAMAPLNFTAAAQPMNISASGTSQAAPSAVSPLQAGAELAVRPAGAGRVESTRSATISAGQAALHPIVASFTGRMTVTLSTTGALAPAIAVYANNGATLLDVATRTAAASQATLEFNAVAGTKYFLRVSPPAVGSANFTLTTRQQSSAIPVNATSSIGALTSLAISPTNGSQLIRLSNSDGARFIALELRPDSGSTLATEVSTRSANGVQQILAAPAGQPLTLVIDTTTEIGPIEVLIRSASGVGTATLRHATISVPQTVDPQTLQSALLDIPSGSFSTGDIDATTATPVGVVFHQPFQGANPAATTFTATSEGGAVSVLMRYVNEGGVFRLIDGTASNASGVASVSGVAQGFTQHAILALPIDFTGNGTVRIEVDGPSPLGIGVNMVPNALPGQPPPAAGFQSTGSVASATLAHAIQRDLFAMQLPFNLTSTSTTLQFTPTTPGGVLRAVVNVFDEAGNLKATTTTNPGASASLPINGLLAGQTLRIEVRALSAATLGDGSYGLSLTVNTTDPRPFLVTQTEFFPFTANQTPGRSYLPQTLQITPISIATGSGSATSSFTTSTPYNANGTGSIQVFEINGATSNSPYQISTVALDPTVNTNLAIFYFDNVNQKYVRVPGTAPSFDYFPADRSTVDARIVVNNTVAAPIFQSGEFGGPIKIFVVVMNEGGSRGQYRVEVGPAPVEFAGPGNQIPANIIVPAPRSGGQFLSGQTTVQTANGQTFSLRTPSDMSLAAGAPVLRVQTRNFSQGQSISVSISRATTPPVFVGTYGGTVGSGGVANINLTGGLVNLSPNTSYNVTVTASSFPSLGLNLNLTVARLTPSGTVPPSTIDFTPLPLDAGYSFQIARMSPSPSGAISEVIQSDDGVFRTLVSVNKNGPVSFTINSASSGSPAVGLYQAGKAGSPGAYTDISVLIDFDNTRTSNNFTIAANLAAGTYWLRGQGFDDVAPITITGTIPAYDAKVISAQPSTGLTGQADQTVINQGALGSVNGSTTNGFTSGRYLSSFFKFTVPSNANGQPVSFSLEDFTSFALNPPAPPVGTASLSIWKRVNNQFTRIASAADAVNAATHGASISTGEPAVPGAEYYFGVNFNAFQYASFVGVTVPVFQSGVADFSVQPISLSPNSGRTLVRSSIVNASFAPSTLSTYTLQLGSATSTRTIPALAPFGSLNLNLSWIPQSISDIAAINANPTASLPELSRTNNQRSTPLSSVNSSQPTATIQLLDANMTAEGSAAASTGGGTWGRYIAGVSGQTSTIRVVGSDAGNDLFHVAAVLRTGSNQRFVINNNNFFATPTSSFTANIPIDFGDVSGTTSSSPNRIEFFAVDQFGLRSPAQFQTLNVATPPSFLTGGFPEPGESGAGGTIVFDRATRQFRLNFENNIVSLANSLSDLLNFDVPFIGDKQNELRVAITGQGTASLNPTSLIQLGLTGVLKLTALDKSLIDKTYPGNFQSEHISFTTQLDLDGRSLVPGSASATFKVKDFNLVDKESKLIPLFRFGAPGIAELKAGVKFGFEADLNAAAKVGFDPNAGTIGGALGSLGVMSPSFIQPVINASATVVGEAEVLGFDIAELSGTIGLTLTVTLGLDNNVPGAIIGFGDAPSNLALSVHAALNFDVKAEVLWYDVYEYSETFDLGNVVNTISKGIFLTDPPSFDPGKFIGPASSAPRSGRGEGAAPTIRGGSSIVGAFRVDPSPQIVIRNNIVNGLAHAVQVVNVGSASNPLGNLAFTTRVGGVWSNLQTITQATDVSSPILSLTYDALNGAVVVYGVDKGAGSPSLRTVNQRLNNQEIRYRYHNGTTWGPELTLTNNSRFEGQHAVAFNTLGTGVLAFVHNTDATPVDDNGSLNGSTNQIRVSAWDASSKSFGSPTTLATPAGVNSRPAVFVDENGTRYVVWLHVSTTGESGLMFSTQSGTSAWSTPAALAVSGPASGGTYKSVAIGSDGAGRVNVLFSHLTTNNDGSLTSALYQRPATIATFAQAQPAVLIEQNATFSGLNTTRHADGSMVAFWQQSDGQLNSIRQVTISQGVAGAVATIGQSPNVARAPSVAVESDGTIQLLFNDSAVFGGTSSAVAESHADGAPVSGGVVSRIIGELAQPAFVTDLAFPESTPFAPTGTTIVGRARLTNDGLTSSQMTISAYVGTPGAGTPVGQRTITLAPGAFYDIEQTYVVAAGMNTYSLVVTTPGPQALGTSEVVSSIIVTGLADIEATSLTNTVSNPAPGSAQILTAALRNRSAVTAPDFTVTLFAGDPRSPHLPLAPIATQIVSGLAGGATRQLNFGVTLSGLAGDNVFTLVVDNPNALAESNEANNIARYQVNFRADPAIATTNGTTAVTASLLHSGTSNNVRIDVNVANFGQTTLLNLPVNLSVRRDGGESESLGQIVIPSLAAGAQTVVSFTVTAKAGQNVFAASIDPSAYGLDSNLANNAYTASLSVAGVASLSAVAASSSPVATPGAPLSVNATITNTGLADALSVPYTVTATPTAGGPSVLLASGTIDVAALGQSQTSIPLNTASLPRGFYTLTLTINPFETILEDSPTGNVVTIPQTIATSLNLDTTDVYVRLNADGTTLDVWNSSESLGQPDLSLPLLTVSALSAIRPSGSQHVTIDFSNGNPLPATFNFSGPAGGANVLTVIGTNDVDGFELVGNALTFRSGVSIDARIERANVDRLRLVGNGADDVIDLNYASGNPLPTRIGIDGAFTVSNLANFSNTTIDLEDSTVRFAYDTGNSLAGAIRAALTRGYNAGAWNGLAGSGVGAINTSARTFAPSGSIGYADFDDGSAVNDVPDTVLVRFTLEGDLTLDRSVNFPDLLAIAQHYNTINAVWTEGDTNYDGLVGFSDLLILAQRYNLSLISSVSASSGVRTAAKRTSAFADDQSPTSVLTTT